MNGHWQPPQFDISRSPTLDVALALTDDPQNFARITKWQAFFFYNRPSVNRSPDGTVHLSHCEDRSYHLGRFFVVSQPSLKFPQSSPIVDFAWYPAATSTDPATFCFISSVRECPVKLLDASDGRCRASYPIIDHRERFIAPHSLAFNLTAQKLYCGFENAIEVFDVSYPGEGIRLATIPNKSSKDGLKGIISALAFCPSYESDVFAAGSLNANISNIALFSESQGAAPLMFLDGGVQAGVMQLQFNPSQPHLLYASFRRDTRIFCWDIRHNTDRPLKIYTSGLLPLNSSYAPSFKESTNQKHRFDINVGGNYLSVGRQNGNVVIYKLDSQTSSLDTSFEPTTILPSLDFLAHSDSIGSVAFHPTSSRLLSASGSRNFDDDGVNESDSELESESGEDTNVTKSVVSVAVRGRSRRPSVRDNSLKLWRF
ncbi:WD40-repeat-containing domain protein [Lentinula raphanica]|nr:WD40-repeat-containing domain protein [Lentinula raphanica]